MAKAKNEVIGWFKPHEIVGTDKAKRIYYDECEWRLLPVDADWFWEMSKFEKWENARKDRFFNNGNCKIGFDVGTLNISLFTKNKILKAL